MNIVIVNDYAHVQGGAAQVAIVSARGLADAGYKVVYVFAAGTIAPTLIHPNIRLIDFSQHDLLSNPSKVNASILGLWNGSVRKKMCDLLSDFSPSDTVIHIHSWVKSLTSSVFDVFVDYDFPLVMTLHDYFTVCPNGGFYNYNTQSVCSLKAMSLSCVFSNCDARNYPQKVWRVLRQSITTYAGVPSKIKNFICVSEFSKEILKSYLPSASNFWNVVNPIEIEKGIPSCPEESEVFTFVGRLSSEKGAVIFAQAAKLEAVKCRFVGAGDLLDVLEDIYPSSEFTGWAKRADVSNYIKNSRAIVFPSQLYETQGMVVAEAAALGVPCIVSDACAGKDFVDDGVTGLWFKSGDLTSLANMIKLLKEKPDLAKRLGRNAYDKYWKTPPTLSRHIKELVDCYSSIL